MKRILILMAVLVVLTVAFGWYSKGQVDTGTHIHAPSKVVWAHLMNFENYSKWSPFITQISGKAVVGQKLDILVECEGQDPVRFQAEVTKLDEMREIRWVSRMGIPGLYEGEHYIVLNSAHDGHVDLKHGEKFRGLFALLMGEEKRKEMADGFQKMNLALKALCERGSRHHH